MPTRSMSRLLMTMLACLFLAGVPGCGKEEVHPSDPEAVEKAKKEILDQHKQEFPNLKPKDQKPKK